MAAPVVGIIIGAGLSGLISISAFAPGVGDFVSGFFNRTFQNRIRNIQDLIRQRQKGLIQQSDYEFGVTSNGFTPDFGEKAYQAHFDQLSISEAIRLYFKLNDQPENTLGIDREWLSIRLKEAGVDQRVEDEIIEANRPMPTLTDVIRFAARDVFEPEQVRQGKLLENIPPVYVNEANKRGLRTQDAEWFWAAHWVIPSIGQAFEMFQRLFDNPNPDVRFDESQMDIFFNFADIAPGFREKLKAISFKPIGRVDLRRAWRFGLFEDENDPKAALIRRYRDLGYNQEDSTFMADFTIAEEAQRGRDITRSLVLKFWREGVLGDERDEKAIEMLEDIGFGADEAEMLLELERLEEIDEEEQEQIQTIEAEYVNGEIASESALRGRLRDIDLSTGEFDKIFKRIVSAKKKAESRISRSLAEQMLRNKIIDENEFLTILSANGFTSTDAERILQLEKSELKEERKNAPSRDVVEWYSDGLIDGQQFIDKMQIAGVKDGEIPLYAAQTGQPLNPELLEENNIESDLVL